MYKIAILGCENSHANAFLKLINEGKYPEIEVVGIYSNEPEAANKLHNEFGVEIMDDYADAVGKVDGIMITARHGDNHFKYALPYIDSKIPMFIDKPITCSEEDAIKFMRTAKDKGIRLCGGSTCAALKETLELADAVENKTCGELRGGSIVSPIYTDSPYGGFYFYAEHLVDIMTKIFGYGVKAVSAEKLANSISLTAKYDGYNVQGTYVEHTGYYSATVYGSKSAKAEILKFTPDSFSHEMDDMLALLHGEEMKKSYEDFIFPVFVLNATVRALESGKCEKLNEIKI